MWLIEGRELHELLRITRIIGDYTNYCDEILRTVVNRQIAVIFILLTVKAKRNLLLAFH